MRVLNLALAAAVLALAALHGARAADGGETVLFDFENPQQAFENADKLAYVADHATQGGKAGKVVLDKPFSPNFFFYGGSNQAGKWGEYDQFVVDVFVEGGAAKAFGFIRDDGGQGWWERHNFELKLEPGKRRLAFSLGSLTRQNGKGNLNLAKIDFFAMTLASEDEKKPATIYLDNARLVKGTGSFEVKTLFSFEGQDAGKIELEDWPEEFKGKSKMGETEEHASNGRKALKLESGAPAGNVQFSGFDENWSAYDTLAIDVFNPGGKPLEIGGWVRAKDVNAGYWDRHNWSRMLKPGFNTVRLSVGGMTGPDGRKAIDVAQIKKFNLSVNKTTVFIDNIRLIKGVEEVPVAGLKKFDFGPQNAAVMPGFAKVTRETAYEQARGFGWQPRGEFGRDFDINEILGRHRPADDLCRDFCMPTRASFSVDVPDGAYGVWLMLGPPGNGWGQTFQRRTVAANGKVVVDQSYDAESFKAYEFRFQDFEDLPGDDLFEKYIARLFVPRRFDVDVQGGQLTLAFDGGGWWSAMVNGLVLWPKASEKDAERWLANFDALRKEQFDAQHVEKLPEAPAPYEASEAEKARGCVTFVHAPDRDVQVNGVPSAAEAKQASLGLAGSPGETVLGCVGLLPLKDGGELTGAVCELKSKDPAAAPLAARVRVQRYKGLNKTAVYEILPKFLDDVSVMPVSLKAGVTRSFWITVEIPAGAPAGEYAGTLTLAGSAFKDLAWPVTLTVWPIKLREPEFPMGMFMMGPMQAYLAFDQGGERYWAEWKNILEDARAHGLTGVDPGVPVPLTSYANGKAAVDFSKMDRFMELARAAGFTQELNGYSVGTGVSLRVGVDQDAEARRFGAGSYRELVKAYFDAVREHAKEKNWLPIAFCTDDEYVVHPGGKPEVLAAHHRLLQECAPDFRFVAFDSAMLEEKPETRAAHEKMIGEIDTWAPGVHSPRDFAAVKEGHRLWLYNTGMNRFTFGTYQFFAHRKYKVSGFFQWVYSGGGTYGNFYLASHNEAHYGVVYPSTRGLRSTPTWERIRLGCNDHRYLQTAWSLIDQVLNPGQGTAQEKQKGAAEAAALKASIEKVFAQLKFGNLNADAISGEGKADNPMTPEAMESFRRQIAEGIVKLQEAMK
ncbi:MAG: hypothetical protein KIS92_24190 [Planctomycetota bacterium]|nr:hypothetical protein [Planctomycetota bacterium]